MLWRCYNKLMNKRVVLGGILAISAFFALNLPAVTFAENSTDFSITTAPVLQLEVPSSASLLLNPTSSAGDFNSTTITAIVSTNSMLGYTLTVSPTNTAETTDLIGSSTNMPALESSDDGYTESTFTANKWGYRLSNNSNYFGMPRTLAPEAWDTSGPTSETDHILTLAAKVDGSFPAGSYATTLNFELVAKRNELDWEDIAPSCTTHPEKCDSVTGKVAIQSIDEEVCNAVEVYDSQYQVTDLRDHKNYWISKLKDGNCWMTQNLDLDLDSSVALTSATTDLGWNGSGYEAVSWTPTKNTYHAESDQGDAFTTGNYGPFSYDPGDYYEQGEYYDAGDCNYLTDSECAHFSNEPYEANGTHGHVGNYYSWSAAIATYHSGPYSSVATNSICPANWRLPYTDDFGSINSFYNNDSTTSEQGIFEPPVYFVRGGIINTTVDYAGTLMTYWSNNGVNYGQANLLWYRPGKLGTADLAFAKWNGFFVRCLVRNSESDPESGITLQRAYEIAYTNAHKGMWEEITPGSNTYQYIDSWNGGQYQGEGRDVRFLIQDMTPEICSTATVIDSTALVLDIRDQTSYRIVKAADGNCWMQDNLTLDLTAQNASRDINTSNTNANATSLDALFGRSNRDINSDPDGGLAPTGITTWSGAGYFYADPKIYTISKDLTKQNDVLLPLRNSKYGIYYNLCAASAGSYCYGDYSGGIKYYDKPNTYIDVEYDICPSGWRMPSVDDYGIIMGSTYQNDGTSLRSALLLPVSGYFYAGNQTVSSQGTDGYYVTSTGTSEVVRVLYVYSTDWNNARITGFTYLDGYSVRCIAKTGTEPAPSGN